MDNLKRLIHIFFEVIIHPIRLYDLQRIYDYNPLDVYFTCEELEDDGFIEIYDFDGECWIKRTI